MGKKLELPGGLNVQMPDRNTELLEAIAANTASMVGQLDMLIRITVQQVDKKVIKARLDGFDAARKDAEAAAIQQRNIENDPYPGRDPEQDN